MSTNNININSIGVIPSPQEIKNLFPLNDSLVENITKTRDDIKKVLSGEDNRLIVIVGPCSIHDPKSALEYASYLSRRIEKYKKRLLILMRVYFEKPRTTIGWKGLINDPNLDDSYDINKGLKVARELLLEINKLQVPVAVEFLDVITPQYYSDLVSWGAIGARTTESQVHRQLASGLSMPIGFKNGTGGSLDIAIDAVQSSNYPHTFLGIDDLGKASIVSTSGNEDAHVILRGGKTGCNFDHVSIAHLKKLMDGKINKKVIIDCSHGNSNKDYRNQKIVVDCVMSQYLNGENVIGGIMLESHLKEGSQKLTTGGVGLEYGKSITDSCISLETTDIILESLSKSWLDKNS
tara:strand:- start:4014 stop:5063 length:1050 start_codon:yes stop_codon:yes gene_type:complete